MGSCKIFIKYYFDTTQRLTLILQNGAIVETMRCYNNIILL